MTSLNNASFQTRVRRTITAAALNLALLAFLLIGGMHARYLPILVVYAFGLTIFVSRLGDLQVHAWWWKSIDRAALFVLAVLVPLSLLVAQERREILYFATPLLSIVLAAFVLLKGRGFVTKSAE